MAAPDDVKLGAVKSDKQSSAAVDGLLLKAIETWQKKLAKSIYLRNPHLCPSELNYVVQRTIDRLIFLRIAEARGITEYGGLRALLDGKNVYERLCYLYNQADQRFNSGLFHFHPEKGRDGQPDELSLSVIFDDGVLGSFIGTLYPPDSEIEFSALPADFLAHVYERFLGRVIVLDERQQVKVEAKPGVNKSGGVFYTPAFVVEYIIKQTLGKLLEGKTPREVGGSKTKPPLRILDPACGSGLFLIGTFQYLLAWHRDWYVADGPEKHSREVYPGPDGRWLLTTAERKRILLNNVYGVEIDPQAVEVAKLSLLLIILEGEKEQQRATQLAFFPERALPDLGNNFKRGNSLIGPDFYQDRQETLVDENEFYRVNVFDWQHEYPDVFAGDNPGFDIVVGNPPFGAVLSPKEAKYASSVYRLQSAQLDTYLLFMERSLDICKKNGMCGAIVPNTWSTNLQLKSMRRHVFSETSICSIVHYRRPVFAGATVDTEILIIRNATPDKGHSACVSIVERDGSIEDFIVPQERWQEAGGAPVNLLEAPEAFDLSNRLRSYPVLSSVCRITQGAKPFQVGKGKPPQTREIVEEKPFVCDKKLDATFRPLLRGSLISRYSIKWHGDYWISFGDWLAEPRYSASHDAPLKIVVRQTGDSLVATLDDNQFIVRDNLYTIVPRSGGVNLYYILGLLNSRLLNWFYQNALNPERGEALAQVKRGHLAQLPVRTIDFSNPSDASLHDRIVELVKQILNLNKQLLEAETDSDREKIREKVANTDHQIDRVVYELYELTNKEIGMAEHSP